MPTHESFYDLREFIDYLERKGDLVRVREEVDPVLEINAIIDRLVREDGPAVIFENVKGHDIPVLGNLFGAERRLSDAFKSEDYITYVDGMAEKMLNFAKGDTMDLLALVKAKGLRAKLRTLFNAPRLIRSLLEARKLFGSATPVEIPRSQAPCKEVILSGDEVDLAQLPLIQLWPQDGGKYLTLPLIITRDPENKEWNVGIYRMMLLDKNRLCMHWLPQKHGNIHHRKYEEQNREMPVVVAIGADPVLEIAATAGLIPPLDEFMIAGAFKGSPIEYVKAEDSDLRVPASAEIVLEGVVKPHERVTEGPFGEFHGYYSPVKETPVFHVRKITMRKKPIFHVATTGMPPTEIHCFAMAAERICVTALKALRPGVVNVNLTKESGCLYTGIFSLKKSRPFEAQELMYFLWASNEQALYMTNIIIVDEDVDVYNLDEVFNAINLHFRPDQDMIITPVGLADLEKPSTYPRGRGARMGIDATSKNKELGLLHGKPQKVAMDASITGMVERQWKEYGFS